MSSIFLIITAWKAAAAFHWYIQSMMFNSSIIKELAISCNTDGEPVTNYEVKHQKCNFLFFNIKNKTLGS